MSWLLAALAALAGAALAGCGIGEEPSAAGSTASVTTAVSADPSGSVPVPRFIGPADDGRVYTMNVGQSATLALSDPADPEPHVDGSAVILIAVVNITGSSNREWEVRAVQEGSATIRGGDGAWSIQIDVS